MVKPGKYGPYVKRGDDTAGVPDDLPPDELTVDKALELLAAPKSDEPIGELDGFPVYAKNGRFGPYVQWGSPDRLPPGLDKPKMTSLFKTMVLERITLDEAETLLQLPRSLGTDPTDAPGDHRQQRSLRPVRRQGQGLTAHSTPRSSCSRSRSTRRRRSSSSRRSSSAAGRNMAASGPLREFGTDPVSQRPVTAKDGRFGVYVTDGETNASIGKGDRIEEMLPERGLRAAGDPSRGRRRQRWCDRKPAARRKAPAKKGRRRMPPPGNASQHRANRSHLNG